MTEESRSVREAATWLTWLRTLLGLGPWMKCGHRANSYSIWRYPYCNRHTFPHTDQTEPKT